MNDPVSRTALSRIQPSWRYWREFRNSKSFSSNCDTERRLGAGNWLGRPNSVGGDSDLARVSDAAVFLDSAAPARPSEVTNANAISDRFVVPPVNLIACNSFRRPGASGIARNRIQPA